MIKLRWFRRSKKEKEETKSQKEEASTDLISGPPLEESEKEFPADEEQLNQSPKEDLEITTITEEQKNELDIQNQIKTQTEHLKTLSRKLEEVKSQPPNNESKYNRCYPKLRIIKKICRSSNEDNGAQNYKSKSSSPSWSIMLAVGH